MGKRIALTAELRLQLINFKKHVHCSKALASTGAGITIYLHFLLPLGDLVCLPREVPGFVLSPTNLSFEISLLINDRLHKASCS